MVKLVYCIRRKQGLSRDEFRRYLGRGPRPIGARERTLVAVMLSTIIVRSEAP